MAQAGGGVHEETLFCDTNVLVRLLTDDPPHLAAAAGRALDWLGQLVIVTDVVIAELCYILTSFYGLSEVEVADRVSRLLALPSVVVSDPNMLLDALRIWSTLRVDFPDAYLAALNRSLDASRVLSFDHDFDKIEGVERVDPARY